MIPGEIIILDQMPLSSNGKIDLKKLPLGETQSEEKKQSSAETQTARILMHMIRQVSQVEVASIDADFLSKTFWLWRVMILADSRFVAV